MQYATVTGVTKPVSRVVLGTMIINDQEAERSYALLDAALAQGCTTLDTANVYAGGHSERGIGNWMRDRRVREQMVILTKGCHHNSDRQRVTPADIGADLQDSLARLKTDYVDIYMLHRDDPSVPVSVIVDALEAHRKAGRILAYGGSNWTHERIAAANAYAKIVGAQGFTASSPNFGLAEQVQDPWGPGCVTISGPQQAAARAWYASAKMPAFAYSSLARGLFSGRVTRENAKETLDGAANTAYAHECNFQRLERVCTLGKEKGLSVPQIALAWTMRQPLQVHALVGAANGDELANSIAGAETTLTQAEADWIDLKSERAAKA
jgi:aryl-alcohol dehydrogenase-like predicted oxidoreductase